LAAPVSSTGAVSAATPRLRDISLLSADVCWHPERMTEVIKLPVTRDDTLWAVMASTGRTHRIADIYPNRNAALADRNWREQQVRAYANFLRSSRQPVPCYSVAPIRRADLPKAWRPLPALGFL
jgi:hypothetical protein